MPAEFDEEEVLGFNIWVAELELLRGTVKGGSKPDPTEYFELLQKLLITLDREDRAKVKEHQRRCEDNLFDILISGTTPPVRKLIGAVLAKLYTVGDSLPLFSRVHLLQTFLSSKDAGKDKPPEARAGALECLATLCLTHGRQLSTNMAENMSIAAKHSTKNFELPVRRAALHLVRSCVEGMGGDHRNAASLQTEALKIAEKQAKEKGQPEIRCAVAGIIVAVAQAGGAALWSGTGSMFHEVLSLCVSMLDDPAATVRVAVAQALGEVCAASKSTTAQDCLKAQRGTRRSSVLERTLADALRAALLKPLVDQAGLGNKDAVTALTEEWCTYLAVMRANEIIDEEGVIDVALQGVALLSSLPSSGDSGGAELGMGLSSGEWPHAQASMMYILRTAVIEGLAEQGQRVLLKRLAGLIGKSTPISVPVDMVALECTRTLLEVLGEVPLEDFYDIEQPLLAKLQSDSQCARVQASAALASLAVATPSRAVSLLQSCLSLLRESLDTVVSLSNTKTAEAMATTGKALEAVNGAAVGAAALLVASTRLPLGLPSTVINAAEQQARSMITQPLSKSSPIGWAVEREAGYTMLGALCCALPPESLCSSKNDLWSLWLYALGKEAAEQLNKRVGSATGDDESWQRILAMDFYWRSAALEALLVMLLRVTGDSSTSKAELSKVVKSVVGLLRPTLEVVWTHPTMQDPAKGRGGISSVWTAAAADLQLKLLQVYSSIPNSNAFSKDHEALIKLGARILRSATPPSDAPASISAVLKTILRSEDGVLGPWARGRDPLQEGLHAFTGSPGGPVLHCWEAGGVRLGPSSTAGGPTAEPGSGVENSAAPELGFPQSKSLGCALMEAQLGLLAKLLSVVSDTNQILIIEMLIAAATWGNNPKKAPRDGNKRWVVMGAVCVPLLAGMDKVIKKKGCENDTLSMRVRHLADIVLNEAAQQPANGVSSVVLQRCAAELYGVAGGVGSDNYVPQLVRYICQEMAKTTVAARRQSLCLAAGCLHRTAGVTLNHLLPTSVTTLIAVVNGSSAPVKLWGMHSMWLIANAAGPAYIPFVKPTLKMIFDALNHEESYFFVGMRPTIGRLANSMVGVLGPEFQLGSQAYVSVKSVIREMQSIPGVVSLVTGTSADSSTAELEMVLYSQMLVLFAPHAVEQRNCLPLLLQTLRSRQPPLRQAAAATLRHLAERDPDAVLPEQIEPVLFSALDGEIGEDISSQIKATLRTLMQHGAPADPGRWMRLCGDVVLAIAPGKSEAAGKRRPDGGGARVTDDSGGMLEDMDDKDDEDDYGGRMTAPPPPPAPSNTPGQPSAATPRLRTKLFAALCLLEMPSLLGTASDRDTVKIVSQFVDLGYKLATGPAEALRPMGLRLLKAVIKKFGEMEDPLVEGARLMEQHQAQIVSALRVCLGPDASPHVQSQGASLAANFLEKGLAAGDAAVLERLMGLLINPLLKEAAGEECYAEWVGVRGTIALLEANAHCTLFASTCGDDVSRQIISSAQAHHHKFLLRRWCHLLEDFMIIDSQPPQLWPNYKAHLLHTLTPSTVEHFHSYLERAWLPTLEAAAIMLAKMAGEDTAEVSGYWRCAMDVCHMALALTSSDITENGNLSSQRSPMLRRISLYSFASKDLGAVNAQAASMLGEGFRFIGVLAALVRILEASQKLPCVDLSVTRATLVVAHIDDVIQQIFTPMLSSLSHEVPCWSTTLAVGTKAAADILLQVAVQTGEQLSSQEELSKTLLEAALKLLTMLVPSQEEEGSLRLLALPGLQQEDRAHVVEGIKTLMLALETVVRASPQLLPLVLTVMTHVLQLGVTGPSAVALQSTFQKLVEMAVESPSSSPKALHAVAAAIGSLTSTAQRAMSDIEAVNGGAQSDKDVLCRQLLSSTAASIGAAAVLPRSQNGASGYTNGHGNSGADFDDDDFGDSGFQSAEAVPSSANGDGMDDFKGADEGMDEFKGADDGMDDFKGAGDGEVSAFQSAEGSREAEDGRVEVSIAPGAAGEADTLSVQLSIVNLEDERPAASAADGTAEAGEPNGTSSDAEGAVQNSGTSGSSTTAAADANGGPASAEDSCTEVAEKARQACLAVLRQGLATGSVTAVQCQVLQAMCDLLQQANAALERKAVGDWAWQCFVSVAPDAAGLVHNIMDTTHAAHITADKVQVVAAALKLYLLSATLATQVGPDAPTGILTILVPLLIETASPASGSPHPALKDMCIKLITHLATGGCATHFKAVVAALPLPTKQRLQVALQSSAQQSGGAAAQQAAAKKPAIQLKNFAMKS